MLKFTLSKSITQPGLKLMLSPDSLSHPLAIYQQLLLPIRNFVNNLVSNKVYLPIIKV